MTSDQLTVLLAERVMHWRVTPERFLTGERGWLPRWRFQPTKKFTDAIRLLEAARPEEYSMDADAKGCSWVKVRIGGNSAQASDKSKPLAICRAVAAAYGIEVDL
jgi:hypothetical protein